MHDPNRNQYMKDERYSIIISSQTDARKKASAFSATRSSLIVLASVAVLILLACIGFAVKSVADAAAYSNELNTLEQEISGISPAAPDEDINPDL